MMSLKNKLMKFFVRTAGRLSNGIDLSLRHGFTSGKMLDYVYRNEPSGRLFVGKILDRAFLSHKGWEAIRERKRNLVAALKWAVDGSLVEGENVLIVDVASGPARYIMETLLDYTGQPVRAVCRDIDERWLEEGRNRAMELGLSDVTFEKGDALDAASFNSLFSRPHIMVSSGFYDWMEDDTMVIRSMKVISQVLRPNGYFVFTNQCGHADLDMVNEVFIGFDGKPLKMTIRSPRRVNQMAIAAGFKIAETVEDKWGYYSVTTARLIG